MPLEAGFGRASWGRSARFGAGARFGVATERLHASISPSLLTDRSLGKSRRAKGCLISLARNYQLVKARCAPLIPRASLE